MRNSKLSPKFSAIVLVLIAVGTWLAIGTVFFGSLPETVTFEGSQQEEFSSAPAKSSTKPDIEVGMSQSSAASVVNQFISQHGGSYNCGSFPEDPNYQICIYQGDENLEFHVESGSVVKIF